MLVLFALATIPTEFFSVKDARPYRTVQGTVLYGGFMLFVIVPWVATFAAEHVLERHGYVECHIDNEVIGKFFKSHWAKTASLCEGHKQ